MKRSEHVKQVVAVLLGNTSFQTDVARIRKQFGIPSEGFHSEEATEDWKHEHYIAYPDTYPKLKQELIHLTRKYPDLGSTWIGGLDWYIFMNSPDHMLQTKEIRVSFGKDPATGRRQLVMQMPMNVSNDDIREAFPVIKYLKENFVDGGNKKRQPIPFLELALEANALYEELGSYSAVSKEMTIKHGDSLDIQRVRDLVRNYRKRAGIS